MLRMGSWSNLLFSVVSEYSSVGAAGLLSSRRTRPCPAPCSSQCHSNTNHRISVSAPWALSHLEFCLFFPVLRFQHWGIPTLSAVGVLGPSLQDRPGGTGELWEIAHPVVQAQSCCEVGENCWSCSKSSLRWDNPGSWVNRSLGMDERTLNDWCLHTYTHMYLYICQVYFNTLVAMEVTYVVILVISFRNIPI